MSMIRSVSYASLSAEELLSLLLQKQSEVEAILVALRRLPEAEAAADASADIEADPVPALCSLSVAEEEMPMHYTAIEVASMTDEELLDAVSRICGITHLPCTHCRNTSVPLVKFVESIRRRCSKLWKGKSGLFPEVELPKSCDNQSERNQRSNGVNNKYFTLIKKATSPEEVEALQMQRSEALLAATEGKIVPKRIAKRLAAGGAGAGAGAGAHH